MPPTIALGVSKAAPKIIYESWLIVEKANRAFRLSMLRAIIEAAIIVTDANVIMNTSTPMSQNPQPQQNK